MKIEKSNKLIAEFMGCTHQIQVRNNGDGLYWATPQSENEDLPLYYPKGWTKTSGVPICYHSSWDWLMPVIRKCKTSYLNMCCTASETRFLIIQNNVSMLDIDLTYLAVVEFIKWYNKNK